jgi:hypothetical protein
MLGAFTNGHLLADRVDRYLYIGTRKVLWYIVLANKENVRAFSRRGGS